MLAADSADFIEVYPTGLAPALCTQIVVPFDRCGQAVRGSTGSGLDTTLKDSWDIEITGATC